MLLKIFWGIKSPYTHSFLEPEPKVTEEMWKKYQEENIGCLKRYLKACEESALRKTFVIDCDGYEPIITSQGYRKILSHEPFDCRGTFTFCSSLPCEKAMPLFDWETWNNDMSGYACSQRERITITSDERNYPVTLPVLATCKGNENKIKVYWLLL